MTLNEKINAAKNLAEINALREETVKAMKTDPKLLKQWQDKYWSLKLCPICGRTAR